MKKHTILLVISMIVFCSPLSAKESIKVKTLSEFAKVVAQDNQEIRLAPGTYKMRDYINADSIRSRVARKDYQYLVFSGSNNTINLKGVVFEIDTELRELLEHPIHTNEIAITGGDNYINGLEITHIGSGISHGGCALAVIGEANTIEDFTLTVQGSYPYGYGDLFGKGKDAETTIKHRKHSGFLINGDNTTVIGCRLYMRSFGHGYFIQKKPKNVTLIDCYVEGELLSTDDVLAETSGPAFDVNFKTWTPNRDGEFVVTPGYVKSCCEDGFRTYGACENIRFINCTAKNTRGGFELRSWDHSMYVDNCTAIGTERAFWVGEGAIVKSSRGDANYGPLLFVEGSSSDVELELIPSESGHKVHSLITIQGTNNRVKISPYRGKNREETLPILVGYTNPEHGESMSPYGQAPCVGLELENNTTMPVIVGKESVDCKISSVGDVVIE